LENGNVDSFGDGSVDLNRREILKRSAAGAAGLNAGMALTGCGIPSAQGAAKSIEGNAARLFMNHVGFLPKGSKRFVVTNPTDDRFTVKKIVSLGGSGNKDVLQGRLHRVNGDLGDAWVGAFNTVADEGFYSIRCGNLSTGIFVVHRELYDYPLRTVFNYFPSQRCGDSHTGYNAPCHVSDATRIDAGESV